ncbi:S8 family serine peptidase [Streptosporangium carneum]|uniref:alpha-amylase n=1 Tax=Streptosporangium carneum TaxID=47481 RepID=A0A9W6I396_9ACTN|nr:S8 family serine peptidase [Streptosporangium carneum]GLK10626.1 peptidase S8 [Streptosporangium carneum]
MSHPPQRPALPRGLVRALVGMLALLCLVLPQSMANAAPSEPGKIDAAVRADLKDGQATFWVRLKGEADLGAARAAVTKAAKAKAVYDSKTSHAKRSQARLRALLTERHAEHTPFWIVNAVKVTADAELAARIAALPEVAAVEPVGTVEMPKHKPGKADARARAANTVEWNIDRIKAPRVWNELNNRGEGIVVAVFDSGVDFEHPELIEQYRGRRADGSVDHNYNWFDPSGLCLEQAPCDRQGHGTHVAGIMTGKNGIGVAPGARWIATNGCSTGSCGDADLLAAGQWMIAPTDLNGHNPRPDLAPDIINSSWGWMQRVFDYRQTVEAWVAAGIFPMFANGNEGNETPCDSSISPAKYVASYSAGNLDSNGNMYYTSSRGPGDNGEIKPNISAPGTDIRSAALGGGYVNDTGTSMASPHVAGAVALLWSAAPSLRRDVAATRLLLDDTAVDIPDTRCGGTSDDNNVAGEGALDAHAAVQAAPDEPLGDLRGTLTAGGLPLPKADVTVTGPLGRTVATGEDGTYSVPRLPPGDYQVTATRFGYQASSRTVTVADGQTVSADLTLTRLPHAVVSGTVTAAGVPEPGATITVSGTSVKVVTDGAGRYRMELPHGSHRLEIKATSRCVAAATEQITMTADQTENIDLRLRSDAFGYTCTEGAEPYVAGTQRLALAGATAAERVTLPFPVPFYGAPRSEIWVASDGFASFTAISSADGHNAALPDGESPHLAVYPFWDDLNVSGGAGVYTATVGTAPRRSFVIEWRDVALLDTGPRLSFSVLLGEDGTIGYRYKDLGTDLEQGKDATIGIENATSTDALLYSYNTTSLTNGQSLTFTADRGVVRGTVTDANDGQAVAGATVTFPHVATFTTGQDGTFYGQIPAGNHTAQVSRQHYGTTTRYVTVAPRAVTTVDTALITGKVTASPAQVSLTAPPGATRTATVTLTNHGWPTPFDVTAESDRPGWLSVSPGTGGLLKDQSAALTVTVSTAGLAPGDTRSGELVIRSTSGRRPVFQVPVTLTVP